MAGDVGSFFLREYRRLGPVFSVRAFGRRYIVLAGPEANRFVTKYGSRYLRSREFWIDFDARFGAARSMISMDGPEHLKMRAAQKRGFSRGFAADRAEDFAAAVRRESAGWIPGRRVPGLYALQRIATEQLGVAAAGLSPREYLDDLIVFVRTLLAAKVTRQRPGLVLRTPRFRRAEKRVAELFAAVKDAHAAGRTPAEGGDFIDDVLAFHRANPQFLPETDLVPALLGPFIAGLDTVGATSAFMLYAVLKRPGLAAAVAAEADEVFSAGTLTPASLQRFDVVRRAAMETLRLYPVAPAVTRTAANGFEFAGCAVPAGSAVIVATTVPHHLPEHFPHPERFDIDRYTPDRREHKAPGVYSPFGVGAHVCLGAGFAEVAVVVTIAGIFRDAEIRLDPVGYVLRTKPVPTPHPDKRFGFTVVGRRSRS